MDNWETKIIFVVSTTRKIKYLKFLEITLKEPERGPNLVFENITILRRHYSNIKHMLLWTQRWHNKRRNSKKKKKKEITKKQ